MDSCLLPIHFDADPLDTRAAIKSAKRHIVAFDACNASNVSRSDSKDSKDSEDSKDAMHDWHNAATAYAMLIAHESPDWIIKHRALDRFLDTLFRPFLALAHTSSTTTHDAGKNAMDWFNLFTNHANGVLFSSQAQAATDSTLTFTNPTTNSLASLRTDWPPALQLASLTTAAHLARALAPVDRTNAALYLAHAQTFLLAARSLFPGCGKVDRLLAMLALAVRAPAPSHDVQPPSSSSSNRSQQKRPRASKAQHLPKTTIWATPTTREIDALYHLTCAQCAATDPSPDDAAIEKLLQPVHEWDMLGPTAQAIQGRTHPDDENLVLSPVSALLAWYCRLYTRTSLERAADLVTHVIASLKHMDSDRQFKVAVIAIGLTFHLRSSPAVTCFALESLISLLAFSSTSPSPTVWTALVSRGILACPPSTLAQVATSSLANLASHLNKIRKTADANDTPLAHRWLSGLDPSIYPYPLTEPLDRAEVHSWWSTHLESGACPPLVYDATNRRTPFTLATSPAPARPTSTESPTAGVLVLTASTTPPISAPTVDVTHTQSQPPFYVFDTNTLLNHLSLLYQSTLPLALPLAVMYELAGLQQADERAVARHATLAWSAIVHSASRLPATPATTAADGAAGEVKPASATISVYTSRGSRLSVAQVIKGVSEDYRNRGGLDNVVLDTCVSLAAATTDAGRRPAMQQHNVVLVTDDLNLRLKAQARGVRTCGVADIVGMSGVTGGARGADKVGGLRVGEHVRFAGGGQEPGRSRGRRTRGRGGKVGVRGNALAKEDEKSRCAAENGDEVREAAREQPQQSQHHQQGHGQGGRVWTPRNRRRGVVRDSTAE